MNEVKTIKRLYYQFILCSERRCDRKCELCKEARLGAVKALLEKNRGELTDKYYGELDKIDGYEATIDTQTLVKTRAQAAASFVKSLDGALTNDDYNILAELLSEDDRKEFARLVSDEQPVS